MCHVLDQNYTYFTVPIDILDIFAGRMLEFNVYHVSKISISMHAVSTYMYISKGIYNSHNISCLDTCQNGDVRCLWVLHCHNTIVISSQKLG